MSLLYVICYKQTTKDIPWSLYGHYNKLRVNWKSPKGCFWFGVQN